MIAKLGVVLVLLSQASIGFASGEFMLCFHRDGHVQVERFDLLCCRDARPVEKGCCPEEETPASSSECPDDGCRDVPVTLTSPQTTFDSGLRLVERPGETLLLESGVLLYAFQGSGVQVRPTSLAGPPVPADPLTHLRTVVLRP